MRTRRFYRLGLALLLVIGCIVFGDRSLIKDAQAQQQSAPPPPPTPPTQSSAVNPSNPSTAPQQSYTPLKPSTQSTTPSTSPHDHIAARAHQEPSAAHCPVI